MYLAFFGNVRLSSKHIFQDLSCLCQINISADFGVMRDWRFPRLLLWNSKADCWQSYSSNVWQRGKKSGTDSINAKWILVSIPCYWSCYHRHTNTGSPHHRLSNFPSHNLVRNVRDCLHWSKSLQNLLINLQFIKMWHSWELKSQLVASVTALICFGILEMASYFTSDSEHYSSWCCVVLWWASQCTQNVG